MKWEIIKYFKIKLSKLNDKIYQIINNNNKKTIYFNNKVKWRKKFQYLKMNFYNK
jgi:hypothetical protein